MKTIINSISRRQIQGKFGPVDIVTIQVGGKQTYLSGFDNKGEMKNWTVGQEIDIEITKKLYTDKQGQQREGYNFRIPSRLDRLEARVKILEETILTEGQLALEPRGAALPESPPAKEDFNMSEIPF